MWGRGNASHSLPTYIRNRGNTTREEASKLDKDHLEDKGSGSGNRDAERGERSLSLVRGLLGCDIQEAQGKRTAIQNTGIMKAIDRNLHVAFNHTCDEWSDLVIVTTHARARELHVQ